MNQIKFLSSIIGTNAIGTNAIKRFRHGFGAIAASFAFLLFATPVFAHHAMGGKTPSNFLDGFLSGLAHPIIGFDHFAVVVAVGLLAVLKPQGILIPIGFLLSAMVGTGFHLMSISLPAVEFMVSGSILLFGALLVIKDSPKTLIIMTLAIASGLFHGYAYGEAIFGAQMTPLISYLIGFTVIQIIVAGSAFAIAKKFLDSSNLKSIGLMIFGVGLAFTSSQVVNLLFPLPK